MEDRYYSMYSVHDVVAHQLSCSIAHRHGMEC